MKTYKLFRHIKNITAVCLCLSLSATPVLQQGYAATTPSVALSDVPLMLTPATRPQALIVLSNSQSMDGNLSGAIMTGANGAYSVPTGFTPPLQGPDASGNAPYTVTGKDNSPSRLNIAKAATQSILKDYASVIDFGLMDFGTTGTSSKYDTWVYYMSKPGGFTYTSSPTGNYLNPCYQSTDPSCTDPSNGLVARYGSNVTNMPYITAQISSDDSTINDVLYATGLPSVFIQYSGLYKADYKTLISSPYPPDYSLSDYNNAQVYVGYKRTLPNIGVFGTSPTNAGYVPYSAEVMYAKRGFSYYNGITNMGNLLVPIGPDSTARQSTFTSLFAPETDDPSTSEIKANAINSTIAGTLKSAYDYFMGNYSGEPAPASNTGCPPQRYVILLTDGLPTVDANNKLWPPLGSAAATGYGITANIDANGMLVSTNNQAVNDALAQISALAQQGIKTYVLGFGAGVDPSKNPAAAATLKAMAIKGGTTNYFPATSPDEVSQKLYVIAKTIEEDNLSTTAAAVNSNTLSTDSVVFQTVFNSKDKLGDWTGNVLAFGVDSSGKVDTSSNLAKWQSQTQLDKQDWNTGRMIATVNPTPSGGAGPGIPFRWASLPSTLQSQLQTSATDTLGPSRLNYLRGDSSLELKNTNGIFRSRTHLLGDIVNSAPAYVGAPSSAYPDSSYATFKNTYKNRTPMLYVGANDGMLHAFKANVGSSDSGKELFAFIPNGVFGNLQTLTSPAYTHRFFADGGITTDDVQFADGSWHTVLVGGLNNGGNTIYALDITDPASINSETTLASKVLWEFSHSSMGKSYSKPVLARINGSSGPRFVAIFGSGYNNTAQTPYLYVVDVQTGQLITSQPIDLCAQQAGVCDTTKANGLSSPTVISSSGSSISDIVYVGDLQGHMWKVDISNNNPVKWTSSVLFTAKDSLGNSQPITTAPQVTFHPLFPAKTGLMVYFGTGQFLGNPDITNTNTQTLYGIWDNSTNIMPTRSTLQEQTLTTITATTLNGANKVRVVSKNAINWGSKRGWYIDLSPGERSVTDPQLESGRAIFTTYIPDASSNVCATGGESWLMVLNFATGGSFNQPEIDINGDIKLDSSDQVTPPAGYSENPVGINLGKNYASSATILKTKQGAIGDLKLVAKSDKKIDSIRERGRPSRPIAWRELF